MQTIYLDISSKGVVPCIQAKQGEVGRRFLAVITNGGEMYNIPDDALLSVWYEGDTDAGNYSSIGDHSAFSVSGNKVEVELVAQMLLSPGSGNLCLTINRANGEEISTWNIPYDVEFKPGSGSSVPTEYYTALTDAAARAAEYATQAAESANSAEEAVRGYAKADGSIPFSGNVNMANNRLINVGNPVGNGDVVTLSFLRQLVDAEIEAVLLAAHPIGSLYITEDDTNPQSLFGGVWQRITDTFIVAAGDEFEIGSTGGSATHTLTVDEMPPHSHYGNSQTVSQGTGSSKSALCRTIYGAEAPEPTTLESGGGSPFSILPPYTAYYVWKRVS